jgi:hypothetical protein
MAKKKLPRKKKTMEVDPRWLEEVAVQVRKSERAKGASERPASTRERATERPPSKAAAGTTTSRPASKAPAERTTNRPRSRAPAAANEQSAKGSPSRRMTIDVDPAWLEEPLIDVVMPPPNPPPVIRVSPPPLPPSETTRAKRRFSAPIPREEDDDGAPRPPRRRTTKPPRR